MQEKEWHLRCSETCDRNVKRLEAYQQFTDAVGRSQKKSGYLLWARFFFLPLLLGLVQWIIVCEIYGEGQNFIRLLFGDGFFFLPLLLGLVQWIFMHLYAAYNSHHWCMLLINRYGTLL